MRRALAWAAGALLLGLAAALTALLVAPVPPGPPGPEPGRALFRAHCASCHGADGRGGAWRARFLLLQPGNLADPRTAALPDGYLRDLIRHGGASFGKPGMPSFGFALGEAEIEALVAYLRALPGAPAARAPPERRRFSKNSGAIPPFGADVSRATRPGGLAEATPSVIRCGVSLQRSNSGVATERPLMSRRAPVLLTPVLLLLVTALMGDQLSRPDVLREKSARSTGTDVERAAEPVGPAEEGQREEDEEEVELPEGVPGMHVEVANGIEEDEEEGDGADGEKDRPAQTAEEAAEALVATGFGHFARGVLDGALEAWRRALVSNAPPREAYAANLGMARAYVARGELELAEQAIARAARVFSAFPAADRQGNLLYVMNRYQLDTHTRIAREVGEAYFRRGKKGKAVTLMGFQPFEALLGQEVMARLSQGVTALERGNPEAARKESLAAVELRPREPTAWSLLGQALFRLHRYAQAAWALENLRAVDATPGATIVGVMGVAQAVTGDYVRAAATLREAVQLDPGDRALHEWLVAVLYGAEGWPTAWDAFRARRPGASSSEARQLVYRAIWDFAERAERAGSHYAALKHYSAALGVFRQFVPGIDQGERRPAEDRLFAVYRRLPLKPLPPGLALRYAREAEAFLAQGDRALAQQAYGQALEIAPWWPEGYYNLALTLGGEPVMTPGAIREMQRYLALAPSGPHAVQARQKVRDWEQRVAELVGRYEYFVSDRSPFLLAPDREDW